MNLLNDASVLRRYSESNLDTLARLVLDMAFQPVVEVSTGYICGVEALMRGHDKLGFGSPVDLLDSAAESGRLEVLEQFLMNRALAKYSASALQRTAVLFLNLDARLVPHHVRILTTLERQARLLGVASSSIAIELSERFDNTAMVGFSDCIAHLRSAGFKLAIDDFGVGAGELKLLADVPVDYVKIDRSLVHGLETAPRKRHLLSHMVNVAHALGARVIAEGVETAADLAHCREAGCDFLQGWLLDRARLDLSELPESYAPVLKRDVGERISATIDEMLVRQQVERLPVIAETDGVEVIFDLFKNHPHQAYFPVVDRSGAPLGIVHERQIKGIVYQPYGRDLLRNKSSSLSIFSFLTHVPVARLDSDTDSLLDLFANMSGSDCILLSENSAYVGALSASSLLRILNDKQVRKAKDSNPLTGLPGNAMISDHVRRTLLDGHTIRFMCYFDFDHFKPFNDVYGFQQGDEAILIFASLLRESFVGADVFVGHIGGDDFFVGVGNGLRDDLMPRIEALIEAFRGNVSALYSEEDRQAGAITAPDRFGEMRTYGLLRCSVAVLELPEAYVCGDPECVGPSIARLKKAAKASNSGIALGVMSFEGQACR